MADAAEGEMLQMVRPEKRPRVDGETEQAVAVTKVLEDDNLLREIIVRVGFPTTLVRAALVCKRCLGNASDPKFLSRFRKLHPPRLLGYYITNRSLSVKEQDATRFVPMPPQPPELAAIVRCLESYKFGPHSIMQCRNGSIFTMCRIGKKWTHGVHRPLCADKGMQIVPPLLDDQDHKDHNRKMFSAIFSKEDGSALSYLYLLAECNEEAGESMVCVYILQGGLWRMHTSATCPHCLHRCTNPVLVQNKIYIPTAGDDGIIVFDLTGSSFSKIQLPRGVIFLSIESMLSRAHDALFPSFKSMLSRADDASSVYLMHVEKFQLCIWLHKGDNWLLVDNICLHEMVATLGISDQLFENEGIANVVISQVGDNGQFVFLRMGRFIFYLDIKCRTLSKVYQHSIYDRFAASIDPVMMICSPTFPVLKDDPARNAM